MLAAEGMDWRTMEAEAEAEGEEGLEGRGWKAMEAAVVV